MINKVLHIFTDAKGGKMSEKPTIKIIWHLLSAIVLIVLLITAVAKNSFMNKHLINHQITSYIATNNLPKLSSDQAYNLSLIMRNNVLQIHYFFGVAFFFIVLLQIYTMFKYRAKPNFNITTEEGIKYILYLAVKCVIIYEAFTGILTYIAYLFFSNGVFKFFKNFHGIFFIPIIVFTILHIFMITFVQIKEHNQNNL